MKFHQLAIGARFRYQGDDYCKSSPLAASAQDGSQRMIPRSATVVPSDDQAQQAAASGTAGPREHALRQHHERCRELLAQAAAQLPEVTRLELLGALEDSYREMQEILAATR